MAIGNVDSLYTALASLDANIATMLASPMPTTSIDGKSVDTAGYINMLLSQREKLVAAIIQAEGPTELHVQGTT